MVRRTTIRMEAGLLDAAQQLGRRTQRTLTAVIEDAVRDAVARGLPAQSAVPRLPVSHRRGGLRPGVSLDDNQALRDRMDEVGDAGE